MTKEIKHLKNYFSNSKSRLDDIFAAQVLEKILNQGAYFPFTSSSLKPHSLAIVLNDLAINQRKKIIEFGMGISTIAIPRLIKMNALDAHLFSIEENQEWMKIIDLQLKKEDLSEFVTLIHAPLTKSKLALENNSWYDETILNQQMEKENSFDLVLVDGPSAWHKEIELSRYPALPFLKEKLNENFSFFLDDTNRNGEKEILKRWNKLIPQNFEKASDSLHFAKAGNWFNTIF